MEPKNGAYLNTCHGNKDRLGTLLGYGGYVFRHNTALCSISDARSDRKLDITGLLYYMTRVASYLDLIQFFSLLGGVKLRQKTYDKDFNRR